MSTKIVARAEVDEMAVQYAGEELAKLAKDCNEISPLLAGRRIDAALAAAVCAARDSGQDISEFIPSLVAFAVFVWESMDTQEITGAGDA